MSIIFFARIVLKWLIYYRTMFVKLLLLFRYYEIKLYYDYKNTHSWFVFLLRYFNLAFFLLMDIFLAMIFVNGIERVLIAELIMVTLLITGTTLRTAIIWRQGTAKMATAKEKLICKAQNILSKVKSSRAFSLKLAGIVWMILTAIGLIIFLIYSLIGGLNFQAFLWMNIYYSGKWLILISATLGVYYFQNISPVTKTLVKPMIIFITSLCLLLMIFPLLNWPMPMGLGLSVFLTLFFIKDFLYALTQDEHHEIILGLSLFLLSLFWLTLGILWSDLLSLGSIFLTSIDAFKNLTPLLDSVLQIVIPLKALSREWFFPLIELMLFVVLLFTGRILFEGVLWLRKKLIGHNTNNERHFLSLYPLAFNLTGAFVIYSFMFVVLPLIAGFFSWLVFVFKIPEIFNLSILTKSHFLGFFYVVLGLFLLSRVFEILNHGIRVLKGYVAVNAQELVYSEPGLFKKKLYRIPLKQIKLVLIEQAHLQKYFCYGSLLIHSADTPNPLMIHHLPYPENIQNKIMSMAHHGDK